MFRASPWISYDPIQRRSLPNTNHDDLDTIPVELITSPLQEQHHIPQRYMDAPEISTLREEEEESPPPEAGHPFSKFRVNMRGPSWGQGADSSVTASGPPVGPIDSDDEDEEDQLIDDDELAIVTETGRGPASSPPTGVASGGNSTPSGSPQKRSQQRRPVTGRRGRPGREPPDAAAMMSTFELAKGEPPTPPKAISPPPPVVPNPLPPVAGPSTATPDWAASMPLKPPRKKPGPKKGTTLGPRGPRKNASKAAGPNTPSTSMPPADDPLNTDPSNFLIPAPPSIPSTPGPDHLSLHSSHLPPILPPDFVRDPTIPVPIYPPPTRAFPVQLPPKVPTGYAPTQPIDPKRGPARKWAIMQREIKGIGGGRWFARAWVAPHTIPQPVTRPSSPPVPPDVVTAVAPPPLIPPELGSSAPVSRASSVKAEMGAAQALLELDRVDPTRWPTMGQDPPEVVVSSRGHTSPQSRILSTTHFNSPPPSPGANTGH